MAEHSPWKIGEWVPTQDNREVQEERVVRRVSFEDEKGGELEVRVPEEPAAAVPKEPASAQEVDSETEIGDFRDSCSGCGGQ